MRITRRRRPAAYGPPPAYYDEPGIEIDRQGWTGGVGYGTSGDFVDGYGMMHYGWNNRMNGPTYNSFNQSFQHNPSVARPFQPRRMGHPDTRPIIDLVCPGALRGASPRGVRGYFLRLCGGLVA